MKISDFIFPYSSGKGLLGARECICRIRVFVNSKAQVYAVATDLADKNTGMSVTNAIESVAKQLYERGYVSPDALIIDHSEHCFSGRCQFHLVEFVDSFRPVWHEKNMDEMVALLGCDPEEFSLRSIDIESVFNEIERARHRVSPHIDDPYQHEPRYINRQEEIRVGMRSRKALSDLVMDGAGERDIQSYIKGDLSLLADVYASPDDDYICFSEFPLADRFVDFVIFSGTSRMDVTLIEIKGADFSLLNRTGYENVSAKVNEATQQIRSHLGSIYRDYSGFRKKMHQIRRSVEKGKKLYNAFLGPSGYLEVDKDKDVSVHYVVIGGRTTNDLGESAVRHEYEQSFHPNIKLESWDSWIKKLRRD